MDKILSALRSWIASFFDVEDPPDPLSRMNLVELADLPPTHPSEEGDCPA